MEDIVLHGFVREVWTRDHCLDTMNCALCRDKKFLCETCSQLTPWPCPLEHDCYMPCPQCNAEGALPDGYE